ncbi:hercules receptor kinase 1 [Artemisia annua]|uniref:Hercules receptor kinase 1 n=1 Tax=Artemisia annua TaxID=35608 RepID=A0A2U1Q6V2_ARTAN|nr:hercules receptor kinase 1 [Artemisia annua]
MMGFRSFPIWVFVFIACLISSTYSQFNPADKYSIDCGSPTNTTIGGRVFLSDNLASSFLSTPQNVLVDTGANSIPSSEYSPLYKTARIFAQTSTYTFKINQPGRHWIRLYFYPFTASNYNLSTAVFSVSTRDNSLLSDFQSDQGSVKEYSVNVTSGNLEITFTPSGGSFAYLNGLEVVSVPDLLIGDGATSLMPLTNYRGLLTKALETMARVNMGGPTVTSRNDSLWRSWVPDTSFLKSPNLVTDVSKTDAVEYPDGGATEEDAPRSVYGTAARMASENDTRSNFNVTWEFPVDRGFQYLIRLHFCDIVSTAPNAIYFDVFIQDSSALDDFDLYSKVGGLARAYYTDFVTPSINNNLLKISIGPAIVRDSLPNAILNGVEILKMSNLDGSLSGSGVPSSSKGSKSKIVLCARPVIDPSLAREKVNLAEWAMVYQKKGQLEQIIDVTLKGDIKPDSLRKFGETAEKCLADFGVDRPSMGDVLWNLEYVLQLQEAVLQNDPDENSTNVIGELSPQIHDFNHGGDDNTNTGFEMSSGDDISGVSMSKVFSQLVKVRGEIKEKVSVGGLRLIDYLVYFHRV